MGRTVQVIKRSSITTLVWTPFTWRIFRHNFEILKNIFISSISFKFNFWSDHWFTVLFIFRMLNGILFILIFIAWRSIKWYLWFCICRMGISLYLGLWRFVELIVSSCIFELYSWLKSIIRNILPSINKKILFLRVIIRF